jgi:hypothetical protein
LNVTQKIVHLTVAEVSDVCTSKFELSFREVALVHIVPAFNASFTILFKLFSSGKLSSLRIILELGSIIDTLQSEKNISFVSQAQVSMESHSL